MRFLIKTSTAIAVIASGLSLSACKDENVSFQTLEQERGTANANSKFNGQKYRAESPKYANWDILLRGDSTQAANCPQGDGWATLTLVAPDKKSETNIKCSTVSANIPCLEANDFKTKPYATQEGACQKDLPFPLPKIAQ